MSVTSVQRSMELRTIRKYGNRRLYDAVAKQYVNLEEVAQMIRNGSEVRVVDAKTGEDLTREILTQIIVEETRSRNGGLPLEILRDLVAFSGKARHEGLVWTLRSALEAYRRAQHSPVELMRHLFSPRPAENESQIDELRQRVEELERQLSDRTSPR
jgi:polyhydroxyalkanoate synthesis repressor PhaR